MKTTIGLWIDHKKAVIVFLTGDAEEIKLINSGIDKPQQSPADDAGQRAWTEHLNLYYDEVISSLRDGSPLFLMGPGEAKGELKKRIQRTPHNFGELEVETVDKLTENQIVAKVREHFLKHGSAATST